MDHDNHFNKVADAYRQSLTIVEETLSKLKETVCGWPLMRNIDLEPGKMKTIEHLEDMLLYLRRPTSDMEDEDLAGEGRPDIENEGSEHHNDSEVRYLNNLQRNYID